MPAPRPAATPRLIVVPPPAFAAAGAAEIARVLSMAIVARGGATVALAGGSTPEPVYRRLAPLLALDWSRVEIFFGDERAVPPGNPASNYGLVARTLLASAPVSVHHIHRMPADWPDLDAAARAYSALLPARLDLVVLGIGEDGHIASLFPGSPAFAESARTVVAARGPKAPHDRLTLTPPAIRSARERIVLVAGASKAEAVARGLTGPLAPHDCPAQLVRDAIWIIDEAAAAGLGRGYRP